MGTLEWDKWDEECSVIGDKGEIGFIDYQDDKSVCNYNPIEEGPIVISVPFPFNNGNPQSVVAGETAADSVTIKNTTDEAVDLWIKIYASTPDESFTLSVMKPPMGDDDENKGKFVEFFTLEDRMLQPEETLTIWLSCKPKEIGLYTSVVHFDVGSDRIERVVFLLAEDKISQSLASKKPYSRTRKKKQFSVDEFVEGSRPRRAAPRDYKVRIPRYDIPQEIRELILGKQIPDAIITGLSKENYATFFKALLIMEEIQLEEDMRNYDMNHVSMKRRGNFLSLVVPGLAERRPSLVHGDFIFVKQADADETAPVHQGFVHRVEADEAYLKFSPDFHLRHVDANLYDVHFTYNRINMRRLYQAVDAARDLGAEMLFPYESAQKRNIKTTSLVPMSCKLNPEQISAIEMILGCKGGPPYVVFGPPGTGKTMTIVEAMAQLYEHRKHTRILVCAPSNSAADYLLEKLLNEKGVSIRENDIFRLNAATRPYEDVNPDHIRFCFFDELIFKCPPLFALSRYKIIICTYSSASLLYAEGVQRGHFSHIFLDEAGQASEPNSMISIANFCWRNTVVVLAGDPMQLGPVIHSRDAENHGLGKSYLERLCESEFYCEEDQNYVTKLVRNYRCHPNILELPSNLFYNGELMACKESTEETDKLLSSTKLLPGCNFPVLFFGIQGCDERESNNPSWFNRIEVSKVISVINRLISAGNLREEDIGIITPYRQQVMKIKKVLNDDMDLPNIKVGSVEQFQGQEKEVVIVSTVRSTVKHNEFDRAHCLGFLSNPRRFNVAITRAISLLIIIGNPHIISKDQQWNKLLWLCDDNNSYQGCALPDREVCFQESQPFQDDNTGEQQGFQPTSDGNWNQDANNGDCNQDFTGTEIPKPNTDEAEWSDGWK